MTGILHLNSSDISLKAISIHRDRRKDTKGHKNIKYRSQDSKPDKSLVGSAFLLFYDSISDGNPCRQQDNLQTYCLIRLHLDDVHDTRILLLKAHVHSKGICLLEKPLRPRSVLLRNPFFHSYFPHVLCQNGL